MNFDFRASHERYRLNRAVLICKSLLLVALLSSFGLSCNGASAQGVGDLLVVPTRIVFEGSKRTAEISLLNIGDKPATYRISFIHQKMNEDGKLEEIVAPGPKPQFVDDLVRFTPRQVVLEPKVSQVVRLQLRLPAELENGEYRSHLLFRAVPVINSTPEAATPGGAIKGMSIKITPIYGISIPVIVRHGKTSATASLANLKVEAGPEGSLIAKGRINREGNRSVYGDLQFWYASAGGTFKQIGLAGGVAVYTPNLGRNFDFRIIPPKGMDFHKGFFKAIYRQQGDDSTNILSETTVSSP